MQNIKKNLRQALQMLLEIINKELHNNAETKREQKEIINVIKKREKRFKRIKSDTLK